MPLRDHFRPPVNDYNSWDGLHAGWPMVMVQQLFPLLQPHYTAVPGVYLGSLHETDVSTFRIMKPGEDSIGEGGLAVATYAPPKPTLRFVPQLPDQDVYEVRIYDNDRKRRLVAAVEIISPSNQDRPEHRSKFTSKVAELLKNDICVTLIDIVSTMNFNLYGDVLDAVDGVDPALGDEASPMYAATIRTCRGNPQREIETWYHPLVVGQPLPRLPIWLNESRSVELDLEASYEETCRPMGIR